MLAIALVGVLFCQDPAPKVQQGQEQKSAQNASSKKLETWPDKLARKKVKAFRAAIKPKKASMAERKQALDGLNGGISPLLIKPLHQFIVRDASIVLKKQAVSMLADQPKERAKPVVVKLLNDRQVTAHPQVEAGLIHALSSTGYKPSDWRQIRNVLESDYDNKRIPVHEAVLDLVRKHEEVQAIPMLLRNLEEPIPENVDVANNPPAAYWKARWHAWAVWKGKVREALFAITGQRFTTAKEAKAWLKKNPLEKKKRRKRR